MDANIAELSKSIDPAILGRRLRNARVSAGLTQTQLAAEIGTPAPQTAVRADAACVAITCRDPRPGGVGADPSRNPTIFVVTYPECAPVGSPTPQRPVTANAARGLTVVARGYADPVGIAADSGRDQPIDLIT